MSPADKPTTQMPCCHLVLYFGMCTVSRCVTRCPVCIWVDADVCPSCSLPRPHLARPPSVFPAALVFPQEETETGRSHPLRAGTRSRRSPTSLQRRIVGIRPAVQSLETWTSSRNLLWTDKQNLKVGEESYNRDTVTLIPSAVSRQKTQLTFYISVLKGAVLCKITFS